MAYEPSSELRARVLAATQGRPAPTRSAVARRRALWLGASALPLLVMALRSRPWAAAWPVPKIVAVVVVVLFSLAGASLLGRAGPAVLRHSRKGLWAFALALPLAFGASVVLSFRAEPGGAPWLHHGHVPCLVLSVLLALLPLGAAVRLARGGDPVHPGALGGVFGAVAGAWAGTAMAILCPRVDLPHLLLAHGLPLLALVLLGVLLGRRWLGLRAAASP